MTYDPIDTNENDSSADRKITIDEINGADTSAAGAAEALISDGSGSLTFAEVGGDSLTLMSDFLGQSNMAQIAASQSDMQDVINAGLMQNVAASQTAMQEVAASQTAMQEVVASQTTMQEVAASQTAMQEVLASQTARDEVFASQTAMQEVAASQTAMQEVLASQTAIQEVVASQTAMQEVAVSQTAMQEVGLSQTAQTEILNSSTAVAVLNGESTAFDTNQTLTKQEDQRVVIPETNENYAVYINSAVYTGSTGPLGDSGWFNVSDNYLGREINQEFIDTLTIGWDTVGNIDDGNLSGDIEAVIF